jgi:hypothetical protein
MPAVQHDSIPVTEGPATVQGSEPAPATFVSGANKTQSTVNSWGQTRGGGSVRPKRSPWGIALAVGGAGALGALAWWWVGMRAEPTATAAASPDAVVSASAGIAVAEVPGEAVAAELGGSEAASPAAAVSNDDGPAVAPVTEPVASDGAENPTTASSVVSDPLAQSSAPAASSSAPAAAKAPVSRPIQVRPKQPVQASKPPQPEPVQAPAKRDPFTDFGGRR